MKRVGLEDQLKKENRKYSRGYVDNVLVWPMCLLRIPKSLFWMSRLRELTLRVFRSLLTDSLAEQRGRADGFVFFPPSGPGTESM